MQEFEFVRWITTPLALVALMVLVMRGIKGKSLRPSITAFIALAVIATGSYIVQSYWKHAETVQQTAQKDELRFGGTVSEEGSGSLLSGVQVNVIGVANAATDGLGNFTLTIPSPRADNSYLILFTREGYESFEETVTGPKPHPMLVKLKKRINPEPPYDRGAFEKAKAERDRIVKIMGQHYVLPGVGLRSVSQTKGSYRLRETDALRRFRQESHFAGFVKGYGGDKARVHSIAPIVRLPDGTLETTRNIPNDWNDDPQTSQVSSADDVINGLDCDGNGKGPFYFHARFDGWIFTATHGTVSMRLGGDPAPIPRMYLKCIFRRCQMVSSGS